MVQQLKRDRPLHFRRKPGSWHPEPTRQEIAYVGEQIALAWYVMRNHVLVERNWRSGRFAEIDLILQSADGLLVFVEVKTRRTPQQESGIPDYGFDAINWKKRRKILIAAQSYLGRHHYKPEQGGRFDAVLVTYDRIRVTDEDILVYNPGILQIEGAFDSI
jgi:Holliday junction resolvase-like predicted endonuclease